MYHSLTAHRSEIGVAKSQFGWCSPRVLVDDPNHVNTQTCMSACQLRLHAFPVVKALRQTIQGNGIERWPHTQAVMVPSLPQPSAA